ncbi:MAG: HEPN domain-containing protein [Aulosira sp. DedQUE10]|nr:HEPN domain-containing protein [Aulosira sp. DedQUE10]
MYVGSILKIVSHEVNDIRTRIVMLTSIIELLLTHNPDFNRFNVEDSINKQFQLKASILIYLNDKRVDINAVKSRLKIIYQQRSNIAHGNFSAVNKYINSLSKKEGKEEYFDDIVVDLYKYVRAILEKYLKDLKLIDFLKEN